MCSFNQPVLNNEGTVFPLKNDSIGKVLTHAQSNNYKSSESYDNQIEAMATADSWGWVTIYIKWVNGSSSMCSERNNEYNIYMYQVGPRF